MSTTDAVPPIGIARVLARNAAAEWSRLWSVRSTWLFVLATAVVLLGFATIAGVSMADNASPGESPWTLARFLGMFALFGIVVTASVAATTEHATGAIVPTLQWTPRRGILLSARAGVIVATTTVFGVLLVAGVSTIIWLLAPDLSFTAHAVATIGRTALVFSCCSLLAVGLGLTTRSAAGTLMTVFALLLVLPLVLQAFPFDWMVHVIAALPGSCTLFLLGGEPPGSVVLTTTSAAITLVLWAAASLAAGGWRLLRTDA